MNRARPAVPLRLAAALALLLLGQSGAGPDPARLTRHTHDPLEEQRPAWSPDGRLLTFARHDDGGTRIRQYVLDPASPDSARRLTDRIAPEYNGVFAPDGRTLLLAIITLSGTQGNLDIARVPAAGGEVATVVGDVNGKLAHQDWPAWSPDGRRFAFSSTHEGNQEIYTAAADGTDLVRVTQSPGHDAHPCWTPDGLRLVFSTDRWGNLELASSRADGTGVERLTDSPGLDDYPAVTPDGRLAFVSHRDGNFEVYLSRPDGRDPVNLSDHPGRDLSPTFTPDGRSLTFVSERDGQPDLYSLRLDP